MLKKISVLRERVGNSDAYPFCVPAIRELREIEFRSRICFFAGENGTGKSTLLETIAAHYGFGPEGGTRSFSINSTESNRSVEPLARVLRMSFDRRTGAGFFFRAESLFNAASYIDDIGVTEFYGGRSLHTRSHGETFFTILDLKFRRDGLFLLDEPEAALSPQRQLAFLVLIHDVLGKYEDAQFIISSHSPVLLGFPHAQILSFDGGRIHEIDYAQTPSMQIVRRFLNDRDRFLRELFNETGSLFDSQ